MFKAGALPALGIHSSASLSHAHRRSARRDPGCGHGPI